MVRYLFRNKGLTVIYVTLMILSSTTGAGFALVMSAIVNSLGKEPLGIFLTILGAVVYVTFACVFGYACQRLENKILCEARTSLKNDLFRKIINQKPNMFLDTSISEYSNCLSMEIETYEQLYFNAVLMIPALAISFISASVIIVMSEPIMLVIMLIIAGLTYVSTRFIAKLLEQCGGDYLTATEKYICKVQDAIGGYFLVRQFCVRNIFFSQHVAVNDEMENAKKDMLDKQTMGQYLGQIIGLLSTVIIMGVATYFAHAGKVSVGMVIAFGHLMGQVISPINSFPEVVAKLHASKAYTDKYRSVLANDEEEMEVKKRVHFHEKLCVDDVSFAYADKSPVLSDFSIKFEKGKKYLITGASGCGKSTLFRLLLNYYPAEKGCIRIDNKLLTDVSVVEFNAMIGVMNQDTYLFNDTIRNNICMFQTNHLEKNIKDILEFVDMLEYIESLPEGLETVVTGNGSNMSGGQRQRLGIARVLLKNPDILLLDEPTSALDSETAKDIEEKILSISDKTIIMIAHHLKDDVRMRFDEIITL